MALLGLKGLSRFAYMSYVCINCRSVCLLLIFSAHMVGRLIIFFFEKVKCPGVCLQGVGGKGTGTLQFIYIHDRAQDLDVAHFALYVTCTDPKPGCKFLHVNNQDIPIPSAGKGSN